MKSVMEIERNLAHATGSMNYTRHFTGLLMTDGVTQLRDDADAFWLVDAIASYRRKEEFQVWELTVENSKAVLTMKEDSGCPELVRQEIEYTNFPLKSIKFFNQLGSIDGENMEMILMITSEY